MTTRSPSLCYVCIGSKFVSAQRRIPDGANWRLGWVFGGSHGRPYRRLHDAPGPVTDAGTGGDPHVRSLGVIDLALLVMVTIWGVNAVVVKVAYSQIPPHEFMTLRFGLAGALFAAMLAVTDRSWSFSRRDAGMLVLAGLFGTTLYQPLFLYGLRYTHASNASLIIATTPAFVAVLHWLLGRERVALRGWIGMAAAFTGIALIVILEGDIRLGSETLLGDALILGSNLCWAIYVAFSGPLMKSHPPLRVTAVAAIVGTVPLLLQGLQGLFAMEWSRIDRSGWGCVLFSSILGVVVAFVIWNLAVQKIGATRTAGYQNLTPGIVMITASLVLGEPITLIKIVGAMLILAGVHATRTARVEINLTSSSDTPLHPPGSTLR